MTGPFWSENENYGIFPRFPISFPRASDELYCQKRASSKSEDVYEILQHFQAKSDVRRVLPPQARGDLCAAHRPRKFDAGAIP